MNVIETRGLRKEYRRLRRPPVLALDGLDLTVGEGGVFGFLGPNGSGKTTTIRLLLGLARADAGQVRLLGRDVPGDLPDVIDQVGALVETPQMFPAFSGRRNLQLLGGVVGIGRDRVDQVLDLVGLADRADDRVKGYSLGMKQRLGIAAALLKSPRLLILDEPSNGLEPAGIREVRELVRRLGADGRTTVFLSSHLLAEVQQVCDSVTILARGRCVAAGPVATVLAGHGAGDLRVQVPDRARALRVLTAAGFTATDVGEALQVAAPPDPGEITRVLAADGLYLTELSR